MRPGLAHPGLGLVQREMALLNSMCCTTVAEPHPCSGPVLCLLNGRVGSNGLQGPWLLRLKDLGFGEQNVLVVLWGEGQRRSGNLRMTGLE